MTIRNALRALLPPVLSRLPNVRGKGRVTLLLDRLLTNPNDPRSYETIGVVNGGDFRLHLDLRPWGQKFAYYYRVWDEEQIAAFRDLYRGGWFIDVGSSIGLYVVAMGARVRAAHGRIASIEPIPFNVALQIENVKLNGFEDLVEYAPVALGSEPGSVALVVDPVDAGNNAFIHPTGTARVDVVTLDDLCRQRGWNGIGAIKMDIEGYEPPVIAGAREIIARDRPVILAEFHRERMRINGFTIDDSWNFLMSLGYRASFLDGRALRPLPEPGEQQNIFFVPS